MAISTKSAFVSQSTGSAKPHYADHQTARSLDGDPVYEWRNGGAAKARIVYRAAGTLFALQIDRIEEFTAAAGITFGHAVTFNAGLTATTGSFSGQITSTLATGTAPFAITSTTAVANLNADLLDGQHASAFELAFAKNTAFNKNFGAAAGTVSEGNHTHDAGSLTGATLAAGVTASSLTSVGTLTSLSVSGAATFSANVTLSSGRVIANNGALAGLNGLIEGQRGGITRWHIGFNGSDDFAILNAAASAVNFSISNAGAVSVPGTLAVTGIAAFTAGVRPATNYGADIGSDALRFASIHAFDAALHGTLAVSGIATFSANVRAPTVQIENSATSYWLLGRDDTTGALVFNDSGTDRMHLSTTGILSIGTAVTAGASAGDVVLANAKGLRGVDGAGTGTVEIARIDSASYVSIGKSAGGIKLGDGITGPVLLATTVTSGASAGDLVLANPKRIRASNAGGTSTFAMLGMSGTNGDEVHVGFGQPVVMAGPLTAPSLNLGGATVLDVLTGTAAIAATNIAAGATDTFTISVPGAVAGDPVFVGIDTHQSEPDGSNTLVAWGMVDAADTVRVMVTNHGGNADDINAQTIRAVVFKF